MNRRIAFVLISITAAGFLMAACGGSSAGPVTVNVTASEYKFELVNHHIQGGCALPLRGHQ